MGLEVQGGNTKEGWVKDGGADLAFYSLILAGLEARSAKKGLTVALWISQVLLT